MSYLRRAKPLLSSLLKKQPPILNLIVNPHPKTPTRFFHLVTVPYTKRTHFVLLSRAGECRRGESTFEDLKRSSEILPSTHTDSKRVRLIFKKIISALERGLHHPKEKGGTQLPSTTNHQLEGLNWEVFVVKGDDYLVSGFPNGKIFVDTNYLHYFKTDAEIATAIGHEVAHLIARHAAETLSKEFYVGIGLLMSSSILILLLFIYMPEFINAHGLLGLLLWPLLLKLSTHLLMLPLSRRMEMEADYIGILLLASAGYDPRVAPKMYEKLGHFTGDPSLLDYFKAHPSSKKRSQLLSQAKVMDEALAIYNEAIAGRRVAGFL